jgi:hypothetical protein
MRYCVIKMKISLIDFSRVQFGKVMLGLAALMPSLAVATMYDLSLPGSQTYFPVVGDVGGNAIVSDFFSQPTGTGVFDPFLTLDANGQTSTGSKKIESAYNSQGHNALYLDGHRPSWNTTLKFGDLAKIDINGVKYAAFILDANEPGNTDANLLSIDNIRVYTSSTDTTGSVQNDLTQLDNLGTLRWALNNPVATFQTVITYDKSDKDHLHPIYTTTPTFDIDNWIKLDSTQENTIHPNSNGGSGKADMVIYIPLLSFGNALASDYVWFYNLNGVHYTADYGLGAKAGYEEWSAVVSTLTVDPHSTPDSGTTLMLMGLGLGILAMISWKSHRHGKVALVTTQNGR